MRATCLTNLRAIYFWFKYVMIKTNFMKTNTPSFLEMFLGIVDDFKKAINDIFEIY